MLSLLFAEGLCMIHDAFDFPLLESKASMRKIVNLWAQLNDSSLYLSRVEVKEMVNEIKSLRLKLD